ncbi:S-methyl-5-thioribose kinase [Cellulomonas oligotrophica]|uniref:Methylthioribose kinase n=1 Tax=Cellulomonas oligotrophica TaxID=931536 RepID=A0A7Y9FF21_9CELL|nr:S-methyl-5-thioribose kinase [Cellulomonas oligotrophica]NYD86138.1 5-methylthioribose kinase [Cellulomonas oligotrophica]GIG30854.1 methylthioribose kinase [Cellulomonas oligotrophica]
MTVPLLDVTTVPAYIAGRADLAEVVDATTLTVREVGDGNLNLVFVATDAAGRSVVLKQSLPYVRLVGESWPLSQDRILAEARGYDAAVRHAPDLVPRYHGLDVDRRVLVLEDLSAWSVWRTALDAGVATPGAARDVGRYVADVAFGTSVLGSSSEDVRAAVAASVNPEMCRITEDLVFTEPYVDHPHNSWDAALDADVLALRDAALLDEVAALKYRFLTAAQALVHGDLHTGSVFVAPPGTPGPAAKVFDLEFAFYGPVGFDLGALLGNYLLARARAAVLDAPAHHQAWLAGLAGETWDAFEQRVRDRWASHADTALTDGFLDAWLRQVWQDAVGFGGLKAIRRVVGLAKASDLQTLDGPERAAAARAVLRTARTWVQGRADVAGPADLPDLVLPDVVRPDRAVRHDAPRVGA